MADFAVTRDARVDSSPPELDKFNALRDRAERIITDEMRGSAESMAALAPQVAAEYFVAIRYARTTPSISDLIRDELDAQFGGKYSIWQQHARSLIQHVPEWIAEQLRPSVNHWASCWEYLTRLIDKGEWTPSWNLEASEVLAKIQEFADCKGDKSTLQIITSNLDREKARERADKLAKDKQEAAMGRLAMRREALGRPDLTLKDQLEYEGKKKEEDAKRAAKARLDRALTAMMREANPMGVGDLSSLADPSGLIFYRGQLFRLTERMNDDLLAYFAGKYN